MTVESVLAHGLKTSVFGSQWNVEHGDNLALLDPDRIKSDTLANRPAAGAAHRFFFATDIQKLYYDTGAAWVEQSAGAAHAATHAGGGADPVALAQSQVTNLAADLAGKEPANANIQAHIASAANPHTVTKAQVGLGNVDNTSDAAKPVSTSTQTALNLKANVNGVTNGINAAAGVVGEVIASNGSTPMGTNTALTNLGSIALTAGDWDVSVSCHNTVSTGYATGLILSVSAANNTDGVVEGLDKIRAAGASTTAAGQVLCTIPALQVNVSSPSVRYLNATFQGSFTGLTAYWRISARRMR